MHNCLCRYRSLSQEEALVYSYIEGAAREGIWSKFLRTKVNLHMTTVNRAIKSLEKKNMIKAVKLAKYPNRKTYMIAKLQPSEDVTGGAFFTDGDLDEEFINQMSRWAERYIIGKSWWHPPQREYKKRSSSETTQEQAEELPPPPGSQKKTGPKMTQKQAEELKAAEFRKQDYGRDRSKAMKPWHPGYQDFPTLSTITKAINEFGLSDIKLKESEMKRLLDNLCYDGRVETIENGKFYMAVKEVHGEDGVKLENGLTESPCGRCPVFDFCEEGGPVNANSCEYFQEWLQF